MKSHAERMGILPLIKNGESAKKFVARCSEEDWTHTFGLIPNYYYYGWRYAWQMRKHINAILRHIRKELDEMDIY